MSTGPHTACAFAKAAGLFGFLLLLACVAPSASLAQQKNKIVKPGSSVTSRPAPASPVIRDPAGKAQVANPRLVRIKSDVATSMPKNGKSVVFMKGHCQFFQGNSTMTSDSAYYYGEELNSMDAFGHVVIHQADTVTITGEKLYYNGNTRKARMVQNCVMTDRQGVLTTDHLNYDMASKIGTFEDGGRITNKDNILVSRTGYYYENTKVAYFKKDVTILTPTTTIKSDTLQYNTVSRIAYFFGPTRIQSKDDFIYCENGQYNTATDQAEFSRNAYYTSGSKRLEGDSLYYDKRAGFGRAVGHVTFSDSTDDEVLKGGLAQYNKATEETIVTKKPLLIFLTSSDQPADSLGHRDSLARADSLAKLSGRPGTRKKSLPIKTGRSPSYAEILEGHAEESVPGSTGAFPAHAPIPDLSRKKAVNVIKPLRGRQKMDSIFLTADSFRTVLVSGNAARPHLAPRYVNRRRTRPDSKDTLNKRAERLLGKIRQDVIADSLLAKNGAPVLKKPVTSVKQTRLPSDTLGQAAKMPKNVRLDSSTRPLPKKKKPGFFARIFGNQGGSQPAPLKDSTSALARRIKARSDSLARRAADEEALRNIPDLLATAPYKLKRGYHQLKPSDTAHYRVIYAFHHSRLYKSDFQAAADSMVYTYIDSTIRCFVKPALWTQGTQMTSDTITIRIKNRKLDSLIMTRSSFIISRVDSLDNKEKFNQITGRDIFGKFNNNRLDRMRVEGNGKSLFYANEEKTDSVTRKKSSKLTGLNSEVCSFFLLRFKGNKAEHITSVDEPVGNFYPVSKIPPGKERLQGFLWRESERPRSRVDLFRKPSLTEIKADAAVNKKSVADSTLDAASENILELPKVKAKKAVKQKAKAGTTLIQAPADAGTVIRSADPSVNYKNVPVSDSTLSGNGFLDTTRRRLPKKP